MEYNGMIFMSPTSGPKSSISRFILLQASSISCKTKILVRRELHERGSTFRALMTIRLSIHPEEQSQ